jgi:hypothetical protein
LANYISTLKKFCKEFGNSGSYRVEDRYNKNKILCMKRINTEANNILQVWITRMEIKLKKWLGH